MDALFEKINRLYVAGVGKENLWVVDMFVVVLVTLLVAAILGRFLQKLEAKSLQTKTVWDDALIRSLQRPAKWLVWGVGITTAADMASTASSSFDPRFGRQCAPHRHRFYCCVVFDGFYQASRIKFDGSRL